MKSSRLLAIAMVAALAFVLNQTSSAQLVPYHVIGTGGIDPVTGDFAGPAKGFNLGELTVGGNAVVDGLDPQNGDFEGVWTADVTDVATNGDELNLVGSGTITLKPLGGTMFEAVWSGEWTVTGGTGRFENAEPGPKPIRMVAVNDPFDIVSDPIWYFSYEKVGEFDLGVLPTASAALGQFNTWCGSGTGTSEQSDKPGIDCDVLTGWGGGQTGYFTAEGCHELDPTTGIFVGSTTWTTANGDTLNITFEGQVFPSDDPDFPFGFFGNFSANGGTGDLANAVGSTTWTGGLTGLPLPNQPANLYFNFEGTLNTDGNFHTNGIVQFSNIVSALGSGETAPYIAQDIAISWARSCKPGPSCRRRLPRLTRIFHPPKQPCYILPEFKVRIPTSSTCHFMCM